MKKPSKSSPVPTDRLPAQPLTPAREAAGKRGAAGWSRSSGPLRAQGRIYLNLTNLTPAVLAALLKLIRRGLTGNIYYPGFDSEVALVAGSETRMTFLLDTLARLDQQSRTVRAALHTRIIDSHNNLRTVALACENHNRSNEALVSAGWQLRRISGPAQPLTSPAGLTALPSPFPGQLKLRWGSITNSRYYEIQTIPLEDLVSEASWDSVPVKSWPRVQYTIEGHAPGRLISIRVRAFGAKGASPWSKSINARVS